MCSRACGSGQPLPDAAISGDLAVQAIDQTPRLMPLQPGREPVSISKLVQFVRMNRCAAAPADAETPTSSEYARIGWAMFLSWTSPISLTARSSLALT